MVFVLGRVAVLLAVALVPAVVWAVGQPDTLVTQGAPQSGTSQPTVQVDTCRVDTCLVVTGILTDDAAAPMSGATVYFAEVKDGQAALVYDIANGVTTGCVNPQAVTDKMGAFRIVISKVDMPSTGMFTIGSHAGWFTRPDGRGLKVTIPMKDGNPTQKVLDVSTVVW